MIRRVPRVVAAPLAVLLLIFASLPACKTPGAGAGNAALKDTTPFAAGDVVDLTRYKDADATVFQRMRDEFTAGSYDYQKYRGIIDNLASLPSGADKDELVALRFYTSNAYKSINEALRTRDPATLPQLKNTILAASSGLNKLPGTACTAKRGTALPQATLDALQENGRFIERAFMSTTYGDIPLAFQKAVTMIVSSDDCKKIDSISEFPSEKEVLFPPGSEFLVTSKKTWSEGGQLKAEIRLRHVMSEAAPATGAPPPQPILTGGDVGAPGTGGQTAVTFQTYIDRAFVTDDADFHVTFRASKKAKAVSSAGSEDCTWLFKDNQITLDCPTSGKKRYFCADASRLGELGTDGEVARYLRFTTQPATPPEAPTPTQPAPQPPPVAAPTLTCKQVHQFTGGSWNPFTESGKELADGKSLQKFFDENGYVKLVEERGSRPWGLKKEECEAAVAKTKNGVICGAGLAFNIFRVSDGAVLGGNQYGYSIPKGDETGDRGFEHCQSLVERSTAKHVCVWASALFISAVDIASGARLESWNRFQVEGAVEKCVDYIKGL